jgi:hypothetical protein
LLKIAGDHLIGFAKVFGMASLAAKKRGVALRAMLRFSNMATKKQQTNCA